MINARTLAWRLGLVVMALGSLVLMGWVLDIAALRSVFPGLATMKANTAVGLTLSGVALARLAGLRQTRPTRRIVVALAATVAVLGVVTLVQYLAGWNLHVDEALVRDTSGSVATSHPGRMSPLTALAFVFIGTALLFSTLRAAHGRYVVVTALAAGVGVIGAVSFSGSLLELATGLRWWSFAGVAIHTAAGQLALAVGLVAWVHSQGHLTWALDARATAGVVVAVGVMVAASGVSFAFTTRVRDWNVWVSHTHAVIKEVQDVYGDVRALEAEQRGYLLTADPRMLDRYARAVSSVHRQLAEVRAITADNPRQQQRADQTLPILVQRIEWGDRLIAISQQQGLAAAQRALATGTGVELTERIGTLLHQMQEEETRLLRQREIDAGPLATTASLLLPLGVFVSVTLLFVSVAAINAGIADRLRVDAVLLAAMKENDDLRAALDEHAIVAVTDPRGRITFVNDKFCAISQYAREELLGRDHRIINSGYHSKAFIRDLWTTITAGRVWHGEIRNRAKDGSFYWVDTTIVPFLDDAGTPRQYTAIRADITERKRVEEALREGEQRFRTMANSIPQLAWIARADGFIVWYNDRWYAYTGTTPEQMEGWGWQSVHHPDHLPRVMENWTAAIDSGQPFDMEFPLRGADGRFRTFLTRVQPLRDTEGRVVQWFGTNTDVEALKQAEEDVRRLNAELEQRVADRTAELEAANNELEAFSYSVSHDLRAPLRAIDGFSRAVEEDFGPQLPGEGQRFLRTIRQGAQRMGALIDDLLTFSRLSRLPLSRQRVDTRRQVQDVLDDLLAVYPGRAVEVRLGELPPCDGDPALLKQVWVNLLSNALKYTSRRAETVVEIGARHEHGATVYSVRDNGTGFDMRYAGKLFGVFQRLHRQEEFDGTGVGLAIVQRIVHRHGGRVWADAEVDGGATFSFTLGPSRTS